MDFTYKQVEELLAALYDVHPGRRVALLGRIKHFQRSGWPEGTNVGKGSRARYDTKRALLLVLAFELIDVGVTPDRAVALLKSFLGLIPLGLLIALRRHRGVAPNVEIAGMIDGEDTPVQVDEEGDALLIVSPASLQSLKWMTEEERKQFSEPAFLTIGLERLGQLLEGRKAALVNLSLLMVDFLEAANRVGHVDLDVVEEELERWLNVTQIKMELARAKHP